MFGRNDNSRFVRNQPEVKKSGGLAVTTATPPSTPLAVAAKQDQGDQKCDARSTLLSLKLQIPKKVTDYNSVVARCLEDIRQIDDVELFENFRNSVRNFVGDQPIQMRVHAFGKQLVTATTRAPQFFVSHYPFFTNGPIQGTTNFPIREAEISAFFDQVFCKVFHVELRLNVVQTNWVSSSTVQANHVLYQGNESTAQSTTLTTAFYDGLCSGRHDWKTPVYLSSAASNVSAPSLRLSVPSPYKYSRDSKGWYATNGSTSDFTRINYTSDTALSADTDVIGSVYATFDCEFRIRFGG